MKNSPGIIVPSLLVIPGRASARTRNLDNTTSGFRARRFATPWNDSPFLPNRLVHGEELCAVRKSCLKLDVMDHLRDARHHLVAGQNLRAALHQLCHGAAIARTLQDEIGDDRDRFGMVELDAAI